MQQFPRAIAIRCADPLRGAAAETRFKPTVADLTAWCRREIESLQEIVDRADREAKILADMEEAYAAEERLAEERKTRPSIDELRAKYGPTWGIKRV